MHYDFDEVIDRKNTNCAKYDFLEENGKSVDVLPLWVADMDFRAPEEVVQALRRIAEHGIYGYGGIKSDYKEAVIKWFEDHHQWQIEPRWIVNTPGVVFALSMCINTYTKEGESILIQEPVYYPFKNMIVNNNRKPISSDLVLIDGHYEIDFDDFEDKIRENNVRMFILCSPHNPVGRVWTKAELEKIGTICRRYDVLVVSDEIHCDFVYSGYKHLVFASLDPEFAEHCIICTAPSKTFNLAGLQASNIIIPNEGLRKEYIRTLNRVGLKSLNIMGAAACQAAYSYGETWFLELKDYLEKNVAFIRKFVQEELPGIHLIEPEGTYLMWLDCRELGFSDEELNRRVNEDAKLWLDAGNMFGVSGEGFERINAACPRKTLEEAMGRFKKIL